MMDRGMSGGTPGQAQRPGGGYLLPDKHTLLGLDSACPALE
jgi:hypothetical protein